MREPNRVNPGLIDKLAEPDSEAGSALTGGYGYSHHSGMTLDEYKASVLRDLQHLLNTRIHWPERELQTDLNRYTLDDKADREAAATLADFPEALDSVVNYGLPDMTGLTRFTLDPEAVVDLVRMTIVSFEPRIDPDSLVVSLQESSAEMEDRPARNWRPGQRVFTVQANLRAQPRPEYLNFAIEADQVASEMRIIA